jgi:hypothetical protein
MIVAFEPGYFFCSKFGSKCVFCKYLHFIPKLLVVPELSDTDVRIHDIYKKQNNLFEILAKFSSPRIE